MTPQDGMRDIDAWITNPDRGRPMLWMPDGEEEDEENEEETEAEDDE